jgi:hypothetical protein
MGDFEIEPNHCKLRNDAVHTGEWLLDEGSPSIFILKKKKDLLAKLERKTKLQYSCLSENGVPLIAHSKEIDDMFF